MAAETSMLSPSDSAPENDDDVGVKNTGQHQNESKVIIHRSRLVKPFALVIRHMAISDDHRYLCVLRNFAPMRPILIKVKNPVCTIEIYKLYDGRDGLAKRMRVIHDTDPVQAVAWYNQHTIVAVIANRAHGAINLYNIYSGRRIHQTITDFGPILCMKYDRNTSKLFVGTESGYASIYNCLDPRHEEENGEERKEKFVLDRNMVKVPERIFSIDFVEETNPDEILKHKQKKVKSDEIIRTPKRIIGATSGKVIVWDYATEYIEETLNLGPEKTCNVMAVMALNTGEIVTGDSTGTTSIFDPISLMCQQKFQLHTSYVLCLAKSADDREIYASGLDHSIRSITRKLDTWAPKAVRHVHTHDVRSMVAISNDQLYSGGSDTFLTFTRFPDPTRRKFVNKPMNLNLQSVNYNADTETNELLIQSEVALNIWTLVSHDPLVTDGNISNSQDAEPSILMTISSDKFIVSSCFNSYWLCYYEHGMKRPVILRRSDENWTELKLDRRLKNVQLMQIFGSAQRSIVFVATHDTLAIIELTESEQEDEINLKGEVIETTLLDSAPQQMKYFESNDCLVLYCRNEHGNKLKILNFSEHLTYEEKDIDLSKKNLIDFTCVVKNKTQNGISSGDINSKSSTEKVIYALTFDNEILTINLKDCSIKSTKSITNIPNHTDVIGILSLEEYLIVYDDEQIYKLDSTFTVRKTHKQYGYIQNILRMFRCNSIDGPVAHDKELLIIEFPHQKLVSTLPLPMDKKKYGSR